MHKEHNAFEESVATWLQLNGFMVPNALTYHEAWPESVSGILRTRYSFTALYLRGRADRVAIHATRNVEFEWEAKVIPQSSPYNNLAVECLPLLHHLSKSAMGVQCIYCAKNCKNGEERGFLVTPERIPKISRACIPNRWNAARRSEFANIIRSHFPDTEIKEIHSNGSGDPFFVIDAREVIRLPEWRSIISEIIQNESFYPGI